MHGAGELHAALLALLLPRGSRRAARAWAIETADTPGRAGLREHAASLSGAARLPWFERLLARMALQPITARQDLLKALRRIIGARGVVRPIDRLHWLAMRRGLGEVSPLTARRESGGDVAEWLETDVLALAVYTAFLSRMVAEDLADEGAAQRWYESVMDQWQPHSGAPPFEAPDAENVFEALARLQTLSWMQRPVVIRSWVAAALEGQRRGAPGRRRRRCAAPDLHPARRADAAGAGAPLHRAARRPEVMDAGTPTAGRRWRKLPRARTTSRERRRRGRRRCSC